MLRINNMAAVVREASVGRHRGAGGYGSGALTARDQD